MGISIDLFDESVSSDLRCSICSDVFEDPVQVRCPHDHVFCAACIYSWTGARPNQPTCPSCRSPIIETQFVSSSFIKRLVGNLRVHCSQASQGCLWSGRLSDRHDSTCPFLPAPCRFNPEACGQMPRKDLETHYRTSCRFVTCPNVTSGCEFRGRQSDVDTHSRQFCAVAQLSGVIRRLEGKITSLETEVGKLKRDLDHRKKDDERLYSWIQIVTDEDCKSHTGFDLVDLNVIPVTRFPKGTALAQVLTEQRRLSGARHLALFLLYQFVQRENRTMRPSDLVITQAATKSIDSYRWPPRDGKECRAVYVKVNEDGHPLLDHNALLFFKFYSPETRSLEYLGSQHVNSLCRPPELYPLIRRWKNLADDVQFILYEEVRPGMIDELDNNLTLEEQELENGDIICCQALPLPGGSLTMSRAPEYYDHIAPVNVPDAPR